MRTPAALDEQILQLDLAKLSRKLQRDRGWSDQQAREAVLAYRRFLQLRRWHPEVPLVPNAAIDAVWHAHILDTEAYIQDCELIFGSYLHHVPAYEPTPVAFAATDELFRDHFGVALDQSAARCQGKPCHAPTPCRCR